LAVLGGEGDGDVGLDAELDVVHITVVHGTGREADTPAVGELRGEGHPAAAAGLIAHDGDIWAALHVAHEVVGGAVATAVGEDDGGFLPAYAVGGLQVLLHGLREVVVAGACLVADVAHMEEFVGEALREGFGGGEVAATVVAHIEDEAAAGLQGEEDGVEVALADGGGEAGADDIGDVVVEDAIADAGGYLVVGAEVGVLQVLVEVGREVLVPRPVAPHVGRGVEVDVAVAQFAEHLGEDFEELGAGHVIREACTVAAAHLVPVEAYGLALVVEEAVVFIDNLPEGVEVAFGGVVELLFLGTGGEQEDSKKEVKKLFHCFATAKIGKFDDLTTYELTILHFL